MKCIFVQNIWKLLSVFNGLDLYMTRTLIYVSLCSFTIYAPRKIGCFKNWLFSEKGEMENCVCIVIFWVINFKNFLWIVEHQSSHLLPIYFFLKNFWEFFFIRAWSDHDLTFYCCLYQNYSLNSWRFFGKTNI